MRRHLLLLIALACALAVTVAACGGERTDLDANAGGGGSSDTGANASLQDAMVEFAECMRDEGIDFPDPNSGEGGAILIGPDSELDPEDPDFKAADEKCRSILEDVEGEMPKPSPEEMEEMRENMLAFAECMREHGIDFPDPQFDGEGRITIGIGGRSGPGGVDPNDDDFQRAQETCADKTGGGMIRAGRPAVRSES